jgi:hypothetical protein
MASSEFEQEPPRTRDTLPGVASGIDDVLKVLFGMRAEIRALREQIAEMHLQYGNRLADLERTIKDHTSQLERIEERLGGVSPAAKPG